MVPAVTQSRASLKRLLRIPAAADTPAGPAQRSQLLTAARIRSTQLCAQL